MGCELFTFQRVYGFAEMGISLGDLCSFILLNRGQTGV